MAQYSPDIDKVESRQIGLPIYLKLRTRIDVCPSFPCVSWRTNWPRGRGNRKTYDTTEDGYWSIPTSVALNVLEEAEERGMLEEEYDDPQIRHDGTNNLVIDSRNLSSLERLTEFATITAESERGNWGIEPVFLIIEVPDGTWRKIMIVDSLREFCTFRSTTTDSRYGMKSFPEGMTGPWILDRSMQDASSAMMRQFLQVLREL